MKTGVESRVDQGRERDSIGSRSITFPGSTWTCTSDITGAGPSKASRVVKSYLGQENKCSLPEGGVSQLKNPLQDIVGTPVVWLHCYVGFM